MAQSEGATRGRRSAGRGIPRARGSSLGLCALEGGFSHGGQRPAAQEEAVIVLNPEPEALLTFSITPSDFQNC